MWLTGGPGCSSQLALLSENGPCSVTADGMSTVNNPFSWNTNANIMWVDQPAGVGYSYGVKNDKNETMVKLTN
jgi:cathepsin A (carboxypeptidase C)